VQIDLTLVILGMYPSLVAYYSFFVSLLWGVACLCCSAPEGPGSPISGAWQGCYSFSLAPSLGFLPMERKETACARLGLLVVWGPDVVSACIHLSAPRTASGSSRLDVAWNVFWGRLFPQNPKSHAFNLGSRACV